MSVVLIGCKSSSPDIHLPDLQKTLGPDEKAAIGDLVKVKIHQGTAIDQAESLIDNDGNVVLGFRDLGKVKLKAAGYSARELADRLKYLFIERGIYPPSPLQLPLIEVEIIRPPREKNRLPIIPE